MKINKNILLLVEDNPDDAFLMQELLSDSQSASFEVHQEAYISDAIKFLKEHEVEVVLCDLGLPDCDGIESFLKISNAAPHLPIIVLTGLNNEDIGMQTIHRGAQDYLVKGHIEHTMLIRIILYAIERKRISEALRKSEKRLEKKNNEILEFINSVTHDLKTPLCAFKTVYELLCDMPACKNDSDLKVMSETGFEAISYMEEMLDELLTCAKLETDSEKFEKEDCRINEIVQEVLNRLSIHIADKHITISNETDCEIRTSRKSLSTVFMNLIGNAINYIGDKEERSISIRAYLENDNCFFSIRDTGMGIPSESIDTIFHKFNRGKNVTDVKGTGLGLYIVKTIIDNQEGRIWLDSKEGEGTTFYFTLPANTSIVKNN